MQTECTSEQLEFEGFGRRRVVAAFDGGAMSSDGRPTSTTTWPAAHAKTGQPARRFKEYFYATLDSSSRPRRVIRKAEHFAKANPHFMSPRCRRERSQAGTCMRLSTVRAARWRIGSRSKRWICSPIAPRRGSFAPTGLRSDSPPSPTCCSRFCAALG